MAWITIMVVAFIIATACLLSKMIDYKAKKIDIIDNLKDQITTFIRNEIRTQLNNIRNNKQS